jgi:DNA polymerase-1
MIYNPNCNEAYELMHKGILAFADAEMQGIHIDVDYIQKKNIALARKIIRLENQFKETSFYREWEKSQSTKVNIYSSDQLGNFLYNVKKIKPLKFTSGGKKGINKKGSTDEEALQKLNLPELSFYEEHKKVKKSLDVLSGFEREQVNEYMHPFFNLHLARTFRSSSSQVNFQNIPIRDKEMQEICRTAIIPRPGHQLLEGDYGQLEVRISACYNNDKKLIYDILHGDMHSDMAKEIFMLDKIDKKIEGQATLRQAAKNGFIFPEFYGDYYKNCAANIADWAKLPQGKWKYGQGIIINEIGKPFKPYYVSDHLIGKGIKEYGTISKWSSSNGKSSTEATGFIKHIKDIEDKFWNERYFEYKQWKDDFYQEYLKCGYVDLYTGFRCSGVMSFNDVVNYPVQGAAFHCLLWSFIEMSKFIKENDLDSRIIGQIHDSILIDTHPDELEMVAKKLVEISTVKLLEEWKWINLPLEIEIAICPVDEPWLKKEKYKLAA